MINAAGGTYTALVVVLFAVVKFTEGAWLIVIIFPVLVYMLIRLNRQYRKEAAILEDLGDDLHPSAPQPSWPRPRRPRPAPTSPWSCRGAATRR